CPKYIRPRDLRPRDGAAPAPPDRPRTARSESLDVRQREWVERADTFFIASFHPEGGADASHRGGEPGFVRVGGDGALEFPDYPGNSMFNTLGNLIEQPRAGLLFLDFERGGTLQLTGEATLHRRPEAVRRHPGAAGVVIRFAPQEVREVAGGGVRSR